MFAIKNSIRVRVLIWIALLYTFAYLGVRHLPGLLENLPSKSVPPAGQLFPKASPQATQPPETPDATYENELFARVKALPAERLEENRRGYAQLMELAPDNPYYRQKHHYYDSRIKTREAQFRTQVLATLAPADSRDLIEKLSEKGVVERVAIPGIWPRIWVGDGFYLLDDATREKVFEAVYLYYRAQDPQYDLLFLYDQTTGQKIGVYSELHGGLDLY